jgi:hypothetical protein
MRLMPDPPEGIHVAMTVPSFAAFVTVTVVGPVRGVLGTVAHKVCPFETPQVVEACATPDPRDTIEAKTAWTTRIRKTQRGARCSFIARPTRSLRLGSRSRFDATTFQMIVRSLS